MARYIEADALKERFSMHCYPVRYDYNSLEHGMTITGISHLIDEFPTADVVEVVRCKDCKYFEYDNVEDVNGFPLIVAHEVCMKWSNGVITREDGYCFLAERRDAE